MTFLESLVRNMFPHSEVHRVEYDDLWRVTTLIRPKDIAGNFEDSARHVVSKLRPTRRKKRKLYWGKRH